MVLTAFRQPSHVEGKHVPGSFALGRGMTARSPFFAGIWVPQWTSVRRLKEGEIAADKPNALVASIQPKAMPAIQTEPGELEAWMSAPWSVAKELHRPLSDGLPRIVGH